jgi:hypothetical protein
MPVSTRIADDLVAEIARAQAKFGSQTSVPDGTTDAFAPECRNARAACQDAFAHGFGTWQMILEEEFWEACTESDPAKLRAELLQVAAVALRWVDAIDSRPAATR